MSPAGDIFHNRIGLVLGISPGCEIQSSGGKVLHQRPDLSGVHCNVQIFAGGLDFLQVRDKVCDGRLAHHLGPLDRLQIRDGQQIIQMAQLLNAVEMV